MMKTEYDFREYNATLEICGSKATVTLKDISLPVKLADKIDQANGVNVFAVRNVNGASEIFITHNLSPDMLREVVFLALINCWQICRD